VSRARPDVPWEDAPPQRAAVDYIAAVADYICSEMLGCAVESAVQRCCASVVCLEHLMDGLHQEPSLLEAWPRCWGALSVSGVEVPFACARFTSFLGSLPLESCPVVYMTDEDDEIEGAEGEEGDARSRLQDDDTCVFGAVALMQIAENSTVVGGRFPSVCGRPL
jgi:hypothetical protein